jgi:hypothetical protein
MPSIIDGREDILMNHGSPADRDDRDELPRAGALWRVLARDTEPAAAVRKLRDAAAKD